jgi:hypothetical protein
MVDEHVSFSEDEAILHEINFGSLSYYAGIDTRDPGSQSRVLSIVAAMDEVAFA